LPAGGSIPDVDERMRVQVVDPSAFTPPYDHALCAALAREGTEVTLVTSTFAYGAVPAPQGYSIDEHFYRGARGAPGSRLRMAWKLAEHVPDMLRYRRVARAAEVVHFQWLDLQVLDRYLLPRRPAVLTAHDLLPREPRPGQLSAQRRLYERVDALVVHSEYGRAQLVQALGVAPSKVHVIHHGAFEYLTRLDVEQPLPQELQAVSSPVVLFFGLLRPYKGLEVLLRAWRAISGAELWIVGRPRMPLEPLRALAPDTVRFVPRFVSDAELPALFRRADLVVLPYSRTERFDQSGVLATALAFGRAIVLSDVGGFGEVAAAGAARLVAPDDVSELRQALASLIADPAERERLACGARQAAAGLYSWDEAARKTLALYRELASRTGR
jgi:glycosyltransferase involved in cell wall biosynthesis